MVDLVRTLKVQHKAGRGVTDVTLALSNLRTLKNKEDCVKLAESMRQFIAMYNPHEAREDTVLFPAFRSVVSPHEFAALGEEFERQENALFGEDGFERVVAQVAGIEKQFGIYDLAQFTPKGVS